jgi:hypothetical protein
MMIEDCAMLILRQRTGRARNDNTFEEMIPLRRIAERRLGINNKRWRVLLTGSLRTRRLGMQNFFNTRISATPVSFVLLT